MSRNDFLEAWSEKHGGAEIRGIVRGWLSISYFLVAPLVKFRVSPNLVTYLAIPLGCGFVAMAETWWAPILLALSLFIDGVDGTVAILSSRTTRYGAVIDAFVDRVVEILWILGFYLIGAPWQALVIAWLASYLQEYMRARVASLDVNQVVLVTFAERPVRASLIFIAIVANLLSIGIVDVIAWIWAVGQSLSAIILLRALRSLLIQVQR